jgi:hypothetical protein
MLFRAHSHPRSIHARIPPCQTRRGRNLPHRCLTFLFAPSKSSSSLTEQREYTARHLDQNPLAFTTGQMELRLATVLVAIVATTMVSAHRKFQLLQTAKSIKLIRLETCRRKWFGTAPFCGGGCEEGWTRVYNDYRENPTCAAYGEDLTDKTLLCQNYFGKYCAFGFKSLCEQCWET